LEYDSTDVTAMFGGAYKASPTIVERTRVVAGARSPLSCPTARFAGSQNGGADFRSILMVMKCLCDVCA